MLGQTWMFLAPAETIRPVAWRRRLPAILPLMLLAACTTGPFGFGSGNNAAPSMPSGPAPEAESAQAAATPTPTTRIGILLPLSGDNASLGQAMLKSAQLALDTPGAPPLDAQDTGTADGGAALAAQAAIRNADGILLGPLTSANTAEAAPFARAAHVPMLAFTSDLAQAQPGVWVMGVTPEQQVHRLVEAARAEGRSRFAALLPDNAFGRAMAAALVRACADAGLPPPNVLKHAESMESVNASMRSLADFADRRGMIEQKAKEAAKAAKDSQDPVLQAKADELAKAPIPPPPFDALLLADTGTALQEVISVLKYYDVTPSQVRIMGPGLWGAFAGKLGQLSGAWFAAPDAQDRIGFAQRYQDKFGQTPKPLADIPYDGAALARSLARSGGYDVGALTRADGFAGVDGVFTLMPDGHVRRGLAIFQIQPGGSAVMVQPAPKGLMGSSS